MKLYEIAAEYQQALNILAEMEELTPEEVSDSMAALDCELEQKVLNCAKFLKGMEAEAKAIKEAEQNMAARRRSLENKSSSLKEYIRSNMVSCNLMKAKDAEIAISITKGRDIAVVDDDSVLPEQFVRVKREAAKTDILKALKAGEEVPGAHIEQGQPGLRIG